MGKRILLVDDEEDILRVMVHLLESRGYEVISAADGLDGLEKAKHGNPDLIILDVMLPKMDGYKVCKMLKLNEEYKKIPVILLTARMEESTKELAEELQYDAYLTKPFDLKTLLLTIKQLLKE